MKVIANVLPVVKLYNSLKYLTPYKKGILAFRAAEDYQKERENILKATDAWGNHLVKTFGIQLNVTGEENLPEHGPVVFVANHQGYADIPICCSVLNRFQFGFIAKNDLEKIPLYGQWIKDIRSIMIERDDARASLRAIDEGIKLIQNGFSLLVFPEGSRSKGGPMKPFKKGSLRLATKTGVPVIPITISGSFLYFEESGVFGKPLKKDAHVDFIIHPIIETKQLDKNAANNLSVYVEQIIGDELSRLLEKKD